jgi:hypothetical protein
MLGLVNGEVPSEVESLLPNGDRVKFQVIEGRVNDNSAHAVVVKDAGDDPDVTDKAHLVARKERERTHRGSMENNTEPETGKTTEIQNYPEEVHERRERTRDGTNLRRMWGNEDEENWTKGRGKETKWKHIENKSGEPWRISTETWK